MTHTYTTLGSLSESSVYSEKDQLLEISKKGTFYSRNTATKTGRQGLKKKSRCTKERTINVSITLTSIFFIIVGLALIATGKIIYDNKVPQGKNLVISYGYLTLLNTFNPRYVEKVSISATTYTKIYALRCKDLMVSNQTVCERKPFNLSHGNTHNISEYYLLKGSELELSFNLTFQNVTNPPNCSALVYIFERLDFFLSFLNHSALVNSEPKDKHCIQKDTSVIPLIANYTKYYRLGLYINVSEIESVDVEITGSERKYDIVNKEGALKCPFTPKTEPCEIELDSFNPESYVSILGETPHNFSKVEYTVQAASSVEYQTKCLEISGGSSIGISAIILILFTVFKCN